MIREAELKDLDELTEIERRSFESDQLSRRNLRYLLTRANATTLIEQENGAIRGYALVLYNTGTSLARLYSLVVDTPFRGLGLGAALLQAAEDDALNNECVTLRLEVRKDNTAAIKLYQKHGYKFFDEVNDYYQDHTVALRYEKHLAPHLGQDIVKIPFYRQTCDFTCGPAALMMAMKSLRPAMEMDRKSELLIWKESTIIFMTSGHGGCSPYGLAISAYDRGFDVDLYVNHQEALFLDSVRNPEKKEVMRIVQEDQIEQVNKLNIHLQYGILTVNELQKRFKKGHIPIVLISSYRIYHEKGPHWVVVTGFDDRFIYVHDSYVDTDEGKTDSDCINMPILKKDFERMSKYGKSGQKAVLIIKRRKSRADQIVLHDKI